VINPSASSKTLFQSAPRADWGTSSQRAPDASLVSIWGALAVLQVIAIHTVPRGKRGTGSALDPLVSK
jgi:hypothetical protein